MGLVTFSSVSMWLEFTYTGRKADYERFEVLTPPPFHFTPSPLTIFDLYGVDLPRVYPRNRGSPR